MTKIDKTDIENIKNIIKETDIKKISKIKIKKNDYEIEISSNNYSSNDQILFTNDRKIEKK
ncbi:MAG: hypothetical protein ACJ0RJ_04515 [Alphaproteobacteria bacterium]